MACDRKTRFIFEYTKDEFFPTMDEFKAVYGKKEHTDCRVYRKWASRKLRESVPYIKGPRNRVEMGFAPTILLNTRPPPSKGTNHHANARARAPVPNRENERVDLVERIRFMLECYDEDERPMFLEYLHGALRAMYAPPRLQRERS
ncbi:hypothetical protein R3P38DRAFT_2781184 [Favolaschia claudopus]|uniref:Protein FAR1-RELATED SEQUENCE n=1 Tax=Favolaschia claudopus TaxID=2862362 RepID=A0AAW0B6D4_9AGAR